MKKIYVVYTFNDDSDNQEEFSVCALSSEEEAKKEVARINEVYRKATNLLGVASYIKILEYLESQNVNEVCNKAGYYEVPFVD